MFEVFREDNVPDCERLDEIADKCVERLERGIKKVHADRAKREAGEKNEMDAMQIQDMETQIARD